MTACLAVFTGMAPAWRGDKTSLPAEIVQCFLWPTISGAAGHQVRCAGHLRRWWQLRPRLFCFVGRPEYYVKHCPGGRGGELLLLFLPGGREFGSGAAQCRSL